MELNFELIPGFLPVAALSFIPGVIGIIILFYVWLKIPFSQTTRMFLLFVLFCSLWQISEGFLRLSKHEETALFWGRCCGMALTPVVITGLHFALLFARNRKFLRSRLFILLVYLPGTYFLLSLILGFTRWGLVPDEVWNWKNDLILTTSQTIEIIWESVVIILTMYYLIAYTYRSWNKDIATQRSSMLLCLGFLIPAAIGVIFQIVLPYIFGIKEIPIATPAMTCFLIASFIALKKYRLFRYKSSIAAPTVFEIMNEGLLIVDTELKIKYANWGFSKLTGYKKNEILNMSLDNFTSDYSSEESDFFDSSNNDNYETKRSTKRLRTKAGKELIVFYNHSPYTDRSNKVVGTIILCTDITELVKAKEKISFEKKHALQYQSRLLSSQINPHFIFNSLNSVQYYILSNNPVPALDYISEFAGLMRKVLTNSLKEYISLSDELLFLQAYIKLELTRFENKFIHIINVCPSIDPDEILIPPMLLQPYIENSIVHGMGLISNGGLLKITFTSQDQNIICEIEDNGIGRERATELRKMKNGSAHKSCGIGLTKTRLDVLNEISGQKHAVQITDLRNEEGIGTGTKITLSFPKCTFE